MSPKDKISPQDLLRQTHSKHVDLSPPLDAARMEEKLDALED